MGLTRKPGWDTDLLTKFVARRMKAPYVWGANDCALFAADGLQAQTGEDVATDFRGKYTDEAGAYAAVKSITGGATIADAAAWCASKAGMTEREHPLLRLSRGDLVIVKLLDKEMAGLVSLSGSGVMVPGDKGLMSLPIANVTRSWSLSA